MKIRPVGAELFHEDGQKRTDLAELRVAFRNFSNTLENLPVFNTQQNILQRY